MKTAELTGPALDWAVAKCADLPFPVVYDEEGREVEVTPSTDWSQGGPIIERGKINLHTTPIFSAQCMKWKASQQNIDGDCVRAQFGPTLLVAAMRAFVASKLGDEVELPEELTWTPSRS